MERSPWTSVACEAINALLATALRCARADIRVESGVGRQGRQAGGWVGRYHHRGNRYFGECERLEKELAAAKVGRHCIAAPSARSSQSVQSYALMTGPLG